MMVLPFMASAEPVTIRSGEHDTFSRLVLSIGTGTGWTIEPSDGNVIVQLTGRSDGFDVSEIFERIPRDRLSDVTQLAPDSLRLLLDCPCDYDAFLWRPGELVVDIVDESSDLEIEVSPVAATTSIMLAQTTVLPADTPLRLPNMLILGEPVQASLPMTPTARQPLSATNDLSATEVALAQGIARAASQGFLEPSIARSAIPDQTDGLVFEEQVAQPRPDPPIVVGRPGVGISTAMDRDLAHVGAALERSIDQQCLHDDLFQIDAWGDERAFHTQAAALAEALAGEFGEEPREAQETLARLYIHFGFGAEAKSALAANMASSQSRLILTELAGIVDDYEGDYPIIATQAGCASPAALWAFLVNPIAQEEDARNQLIQQFYALPQPLRGQISPRLARRFVEVGEPNAASQLLRATDNSDAGATHDVQSARAVVAEGFNDPDGALSLLSHEVEDNARTTPQSMIRLIELELEQGLLPSEANLLLVAALRQEHRDTPIAQDLADIEAIGRVAIGQFQTALDLIQDREDETAFAILNTAFRAITQQAAASTFLRFAYSDLPTGLTPETENIVARRLIDLGFPERAIVMLQGPAEREAAANRRYLRAEAAIGTHDFVGVIESLLGMTDDRARALRARAYEGLGEHRAALAALNPDQTGSTPTLQFRAGAWERLIVEDDEVLSAFAHAVLEPPNFDDVETLADRRAILAQSQESRHAVEGLLLRFDGTTLQD
jgi:hypothetical protein